MTGVMNEQRPASMLSAIWAARYRTPARFVGLIALLLPWTTTGLTFALVPWLIAFAFVDLREHCSNVAKSLCGSGIIVIRSLQQCPGIGNVKAILEQ